MREASAILLLSVTVLLALSVYSFHPSDPSFNHAVDGQAANTFGLVGAWVADLALQLLGYGALLLLMMLSLWSWRMLRERKVIVGGWRAWFWLPAIISCSTLAQLHLQPGWLGLEHFPAGCGGAIGTMLAEGLRLSLGFWGLSFLLVAIILSSMIVATESSPRKSIRALLLYLQRGTQHGLVMFQWLSSHLRHKRAHIEHRVRQRSERDEHIQSALDQSQEIRLDKLLEQQKEDPQAHSADSEVKEAVQEQPNPAVSRPLPSVPIDHILDEVAKQLPSAKKTSEADRNEVKDAPLLAAELAGMGVDDIPDISTADIEEEQENTSPTVDKDSEKDTTLSLNTLDLPQDILPELSHDDTHQEHAPAKKPHTFALPDIGTFRPAKNIGEVYTTEELSTLADLLEEKLRDYKVEGSVQAVKPGPVVTQFEYQPAPGTKVSRIIGLQEDLARSMAAISVRVAGNIPGKHVIGIELPNKKRQTVSLHQVLSSEDFRLDRQSLPMALGVDISGHSVVSDLAAMPHLLVAGTTGSGKSVSINTMICSMLMKHTPTTLRMIMVDPKMLELSMYNDIPHLLVPVVTSPKKAARALDWAVMEMERRYQLMSDAKVRNLEGYNQWAEHTEGQEILPMIVIIIDELADLMMVAGKDVEQSICRLAQKARAAGLHLILATQRPSVDVITGLIKANLPSRLAFRVSSRVDARTILDQMGAEQLLGQGDALLMTGGCHMSRVHGAFVSDAEVEALTDYLRSQGVPDYHQEVLDAPMGSDDGEADAEVPRDSKYDEAIALVREKGKCSVSMIQRHMRIGYNRAGRIVDQMEREGVVSAPGTGGIREILGGSMGDERIGGGE